MRALTIYSDNANVPRREKNQIVKRQTTARAFRYLRAKEAQQLFVGSVIKGWTIVDDVPTRSKTTGRLETAVRCADGHVLRIETALLEYAVVPSVCTACVAAEALRKAGEKAAERNLIKTITSQWREENRKKLAQVNVEEA